MTKIKICGLSREEDIQAVNETRPDFCGFIIDCPRSRRNVSPERVKELVKGLRGDIVPVGVFVNAPLALPAKMVREGVIRAIQLHGQEDEAYIRRLKEQTEVPVIKAIPMDESQDARRAQESPADLVILDKGGGGTGQVFDWKLAQGVTRPFLLAGGLNLQNLEIALEAVNPWGVDLSSGVETQGYKDREKIIAAVAAVRKRQIQEENRR